MKVIPIKPEPNQSLFSRLGDYNYSLEIITRNGCQYITVAVNGTTLVRSRALKSFAPVEGDLVLVDTQGSDDPTWEQLGTRFKLVCMRDDV